MYISIYDDQLQSVGYTNKSLIEALGYGESKDAFIQEVRKNKLHKHHPRIS